MCIRSKTHKSPISPSPSKMTPGSLSNTARRASVACDCCHRRVISIGACISNDVKKIKCKSHPLYPTHPCDACLTRKVMCSYERTTGMHCRTSPIRSPGQPTSLEGGFSSEYGSSPEREGRSGSPGPSETNEPPTLMNLTPGSAPHPPLISSLVLLDFAFAVHIGLHGPVASPIFSSAISFSRLYSLSLQARGLFLDLDKLVSGVVPAHFLAAMASLALSSVRAGESSYFSTIAHELLSTSHDEESMMQLTRMHLDLTKAAF